MRNETLTESNFRTIVETAYRGLVTECFNKKIEEQRELVHSVVSEMVYRSLKEGIKLREETVDDDDDLDLNNELDPKETAEEQARREEEERREAEDERAESDAYFNQFAKAKPEEEHQEGEVIDYDGFKIEKKNGAYVFTLSDNPKSIIYSTSLNKLEQNLDYIFSSVDPNERAAKMKEYTGTPYLCRPYADENLDKLVVGGDEKLPELGFEINLDGFGVPNRWAKKSRAEEKRTDV